LTECSDVQQGPDDAEPGLVAEELEHPHGGLELVLREGITLICVVT
jgi:hypothetical protein